MNAIGGPWIIAAQPFVNQQRQVELIRPFHCVVQSKVVVEPPVDLHPVQHVPAIRGRLILIPGEKTMAVEGQEALSILTWYIPASAMKK